MRYLLAILFLAGCSLSNGAPAFRCPPGETCDIVCSSGAVAASAGVDEPARGCDVLCEAGSSCQVTCGPEEPCTMVCEDASCGLLCLDGDCRQQCNGGSCVLDCVDGACHQSCNDAECTENRDATAAPADAPCRGGWQCESGYCFGGTCTVGCASDADCSDERWCSLRDGVCYKACETAECEQGLSCKNESRPDGTIAICK